MRVLQYVGILLIVGLVALLVWRGLNQAVTLDHTQVELQSKEESLRMMRLLALELRTTSDRETLAARLQAEYGDFVKLEGTDKLHLGEIELRFDADDRLVDIVVPKASLYEPPVVEGRD